MNLHAALVQTAFFHAKELLCNVSLRVIANKLQQHLRWDNSNQLSTFGVFILALPEVHPDVPSTSWTRFITTINDTDGVNKRSERGVAAAPTGSMFLICEGKPLMKTISGPTCQEIRRNTRCRAGVSGRGLI